MTSLNRALSSLLLYYAMLAGQKMYMKNEIARISQLMMGTMDQHYYILLTLATYLEMWLGSGDALLNPFIFGDYGVDPKTRKMEVDRQEETSCRLH
jgi:hypothetical protein